MLDFSGGSLQETITWDPPNGKSRKIYRLKKGIGKMICDRSLEGNRCFRKFSDVCCVLPIVNLGEFLFNEITFASLSFQHFYLQV